MTAEILFAKFLATVLRPGEHLQIALHDQELKEAFPHPSFPTQPSRWEQIQAFVRDNKVMLIENYDGTIIFRHDGKPEIL